MKKQPNYLFIMTDQHRADHLGCYGNPIVKTPNIDQLAAKGTRFDRFYVANPICMCNRASILTGRMPSQHGVRHNGIPLSTTSTTFVDLLRDAGYKTALIGKSHIQNMTGLSSSLSYKFDETLTPPAEELREADKHLRKGDDYEQELQGRWRDDPKHRVKTPFYGFDEVIIANDHADCVTGDYEVWLKQQRTDADNLKGKKNAIPDNRYNSPQAWRTRVPEELYPTNYIANQTQNYIEKHVDSGEEAPFFVMMSFPDPHHPFTPPGKYWDMYNPDDIPLPNSFGKGDIPPLVELKKAMTKNIGRNSQDPFMVTEREAKEITALTYGSITMIDDAVGRVIATLEEKGIADNTIICFTSDHGDYMGDHGLMLKLLMHYQGLIRIPFVWYDPTQIKNAEVSQDLCSSIDIAPTILQRSKIQGFNGIQGIDMFTQNSARKGLIIEEDSQRSMVGFEKPQRIRTYLTCDWRLSLRHEENWDELYDLNNDPDELNNLWFNPNYEQIKSELIEAMLRENIALQDRSPFPTYRA